MRRLIVPTLLALLAPLPALAQRAPEPPVTYQQKTVLNITEDELVEGGTDNPSMSLIEVRPLARQTTMIKLRGDFIHEMLRAAEDL